MKRALLAFVLLLFVASPAFAQTHSGFTVFANLGVGFQNDTDYQETAPGVGGLNARRVVFYAP